MNHSRSVTDRSELEPPECANQQRSRVLLEIVLAALLILIAFLSLLALSSLDDNRLVSWRWVFADVSSARFIGTLTVGMFIAYIASRLSLPEKTSIIILTFSSFFIASLLWGAPEVIIDASRYFVQAKYMELYGAEYFLKEWGNEIPAWTDLPLIPFLYGALFRIFGESRICIQIFNTLLFSGSIFLTYLIGKSLWNKNIGLYAGALLLGMPYLMVQTPLMMIDIATMFSLTLALFATIKAAKSGNTVHCIIAALTITIALLTKYSNWLMLSVIPIVFLASVHPGRKIIVQRATLTGLCVILFMSFFILTKYDLVLTQLKLLNDFQAPALYRWQESWISTLFFQIHPVITIAAILSVYIAFRKRDVNYLIIGWMAILVFLLEIKRIRYSIAVFPMLAIMAAYGVTALENIETRKFIVAGTVISGLIMVFIGYLPFLKTTSGINMIQAGRYLDSIHTGKIHVFVLPQTASTINPLTSIPMLDFCTKRNIVYYDGSDYKIPQDSAELPWRWTWETENPLYIAKHESITAEAETIVVIQSERSQQPAPHLKQTLESYDLTREFSKSSSVFRYRTLVFIYQHK